MTQIEAKALAYWDEVVVDTYQRAPIETWRAYMRQVYGRLIRDWLRPPSSGLCLKTDLFEEAVSAHHPFADLGPGAAGIDGSQAVVRKARANLMRPGEPPRLLVSDLRALPFQSGSVAAILSGSSLDHFSDPADLERGLAELRRALKPGGVLVITFDNPHNPLVWIRNHLPFALLNRIGLAPYFVGATYTLAEARQALERLGWVVTRTSAVAHAPRAPAIWLSALANRLRWPAFDKFLYGLLGWFESLERLPTRYFTGYYLALQAEAPIE